MPTRKKNLKNQQKAKKNIPQKELENLLKGFVFKKITFKSNFILDYNYLGTLSLAKMKFFLVVLNSFTIILKCSKRYIMLLVFVNKIFVIDGKGFLSDKSCYNNEFLEFLKFLCKTRSLYVTPPSPKFRGDGSYYCSLFLKLFQLGYSFTDIVSKLQNNTIPLN